MVFVGKICRINEPQIREMMRLSMMMKTDERESEREERREKARRGR